MMRRRVSMGVSAQCNRCATCATQPPLDWNAGRATAVLSHGDWNVSREQAVRSELVIEREPRLQLAGDSERLFQRPPVEFVERPGIDTVRRIVCQGFERGLMSQPNCLDKEKRR